MTITKYGRRFFVVYDDSGELVCVTVYRKGAREVVRLLTDSRTAGAKANSCSIPAERRTK